MLRCRLYRILLGSKPRCYQYSKRISHSVAKNISAHHCHARTLQSAQIKTELLRKAEEVSRGLEASQEQQESILALIKSLEKKNPTKSYVLLSLRLQTILCPVGSPRDFPLSLPRLSSRFPVTFPPPSYLIVATHLSSLLSI
jgi:hypothetical protein